MILLLEAMRKLSLNTKWGWFKNQRIESHGKGFMGHRDTFISLQQEEHHHRDQLGSAHKLTVRRARRRAAISFPAQATQSSSRLAQWDPGTADPPPGMHVLGSLPMPSSFPNEQEMLQKEKGNCDDYHSPLQPLEIGGNTAKCPP